MRKTMLAILAAATTGLASAGELASSRAAATPASAVLTVDMEPADSPQDVDARTTLAQASHLINAHQAQAAIDLLDPLVAALEARYKDSPRKLYCAHGAAESLAYMAMASVANVGAVALDFPYCDAYFMRGFAEIDLHRQAKALADYGRALALAPRYPHYLSEMGELHSMLHDWPGALKYFSEARDDAPAFAPPDKATDELGRALRGIGYVDVELGKLDEAEATYRRCLEIDPQDKKASGELGYVLHLKARQLGLGQ